MTKSIQARAAAWLALLSLWLAAPVAAEPQTPLQVFGGAEASAPSIPSVWEGDLRNLPPAPLWRAGDPIREIPQRKNRREDMPDLIAPANPATWTRDLLLSLQQNAQPTAVDPEFGTPILNFAGQAFTGVNPPDTSGEVGANYYVQTINSGSGAVIAFYDKATGNLVTPPFNLDTLGSGNCRNGLGDPIPLYDELAGRWVLTEFSSFGNRLCVYVSRTSDPISGGWFNYEFTAPNFPDYPKYGVWPDAYYLSSNENLPALYALDRASMLIGAPATSQRLTVAPLNGFGFQAVIPSDLDGSTPPPLGAPNYFMRHRDDEIHNFNNDPTRDFLEIFEFEVDFANPANTRVTGPFPVPITEFDSTLCGTVSFNCFPQPGTSVTLDPLREVVMWRLQYRNFGNYETLVGNLVTDIDGQDTGGIRWFELRKQGAGNWTLFQEGTYALPDGNSRWMGSIAMDIAGNMAMGYSVSSRNLFPAIRYAGRLAADPAGTLPQGEHSIREGTGSNSSNRWGDYSSLNVDPADGCTFWYTHMVSLPNRTWSTQIANFRFAGCANPNPTEVDLKINGVDGPVLVEAGEDLVLSARIDGGDLAGNNVDLWLNAVNPTTGLLSFTASQGWISGVAPAGPINVPASEDRELFRGDFPFAGGFRFIFCLDQNADGRRTCAAEDTAGGLIR